MSTFTILARRPSSGDPALFDNVIDTGIEAESAIEATEQDLAHREVAPGVLNFAMPGIVIDEETAAVTLVKATPNEATQTYTVEPIDLTPVL